MIRNILVSLLFFFGPVVVMLALRYLGLLLRFWLLTRTSRQQGEIIDITPRPPSRTFLIVIVVLGLLFSALVWMRLSSHEEVAGLYVPPHLDRSGQVVPGRFKPAKRGP